MHLQQNFIRHIAFQYFVWHDDAIANHYLSLHHRVSPDNGHSLAFIFHI
jgi:hypothetical protein